MRKVRNKTGVAPNYQYYEDFKNFIRNNTLEEVGDIGG